MARVALDKWSQILAFVAVAVGFIASLLACIGIGTPKWYISGTATYVTTSANFFSLCSYDPTSGNLISCISRSGSSHPLCSAYYSTTTVVTSQSDCNNRMMNASGLGIVGILLLFFGIVATVIMAFGSFTKAFLNFIPGILLFFACLFMLAAMAEGARYISYNGYSANLYQAGHLFTILALFLSVVAGGRIGSSGSNSG